MTLFLTFVYVDTVDDSGGHRLVGFYMYVMTLFLTFVNVNTVDDSGGHRLVGFYMYVMTLFLTFVYSPDQSKL